MRLTLVLLFAGCGGSPPAADPVVFDDAPVEEPVQPAPPPELTIEGETLFRLDTTTPRFDRPVRGAPEGSALWMQLASNGGKRALRYRHGADGAEEEVAPAGWHLPVVGVASEAGDVLFCWNTLTGPESATGAMPHPTTGVGLTCRVRTQRAYGDPVTVAGTDVPCWLVEAIPDGDAWRVQYARNESGWMIGPPAPDDGIFEVRLEGAAVGEPVAIDQLGVTSPDDG